MAKPNRCTRCFGVGFVRSGKYCNCSMADRLRLIDRIGMLAFIVMLAFIAAILMRR